MIRTFTQTDLIRYFYHETTEEETQEISLALKRDFRLKQLFQELRDMLHELDEATLQPSTSVVAKILNYSRGTLQPEV